MSSDFSDEIYSLVTRPRFPSDNFQVSEENVQVSSFSQLPVAINTAEVASGGSWRSEGNQVTLPVMDKTSGAAFHPRLGFDTDTGEPTCCEDDTFRSKEHQILSPEQKEIATDGGEVYTMGEFNFDAMNIVGTEVYTVEELNCDTMYIDGTEVYGVGELNCNSEFDIKNYHGGNEVEHVNDNFDKLDEILAEMSLSEAVDEERHNATTEEHWSLSASQKSSDGSNILPSAYNLGDKSSLKALTSNDFISCDITYNDLQILLGLEDQAIMF
ncbi:hypothetical protein R1sor_023577 [Riccia sorocarpa]|uniref:Uncharacterized protein n=1 Tax=Riccia sorocarpa TaxID=122646 RepID=A0ABD3GS25_9MARC